MSTSHWAAATFRGTPDSEIFAAWRTERSVIYRNDLPEPGLSDYLCRRA